jgi:rhizosphere induced protein
MSTKYSLTVTNNSTQFQDLCVYQKPVDLGVPNAVSLAWLTAPAWPNTTVTFNWTLDYSFMWSQTGSLKPGVTFQAQQIVPADPDSLTSNQIQFDFRNGAFTFLPGAAAGTPELGSLYIRQLGGVPANGAMVGIGMSNAGTFAVAAQPNINLVFTPHPEYWVTAGTFAQGQVLDIEEITNEAEVPYDGTFAMQAVLSSTNEWTVSNRDV